MMRGMQNVMRAQAAMAGQARQTTRLGQVSAYDPSTYSIKVQFPPADPTTGDIPESGWIPLGALSVGSGWGVYAAPVIGDQIEVNFQDGGHDAGIGGLRIFDNESPPISVPSGEIWAVHKSGAFFKLTNDGKASFSDSNGGSVVLNGDGTVSSTGTWTHTGDWNVSGDTAFTGSVKANGHAIDDTHKHTGVETGSGVTGAPQ